MTSKGASRKAGTITHARAKAILDDVLPFSVRGSHYRAGVKCDDPDLLAFQNSHPLAILSGMTCDHFAWQPNDMPPDGRGFVEPLARMAWIGGCYRSPRWADRTPRALIGSTLRDVWSTLRHEVFASLGAPKVCQAPDCGTDLSAGYEVDHIDPQHADMVDLLIVNLGGAEAEADWWGYRWQWGTNNRLRDHFAAYPDKPLDLFAGMIRTGTYQALCKPCHKATTKRRRGADGEPGGAE